MSDYEKQGTAFDPGAVGHEKIGRATSPDYRALLVEAGERLDSLVNAQALKGVREQVAGWNGEGKADGPYERHPSRLGAGLPRTNCGAVYDLDEALQDARATLSRIKEAIDKDDVTK